jgi:hypothetical protein
MAVPLKRTATVVVVAALAASCAGSASTSTTSVEGRITAGPSCPAQRRDQACADKPLQVTVRLSRVNGSEAARTRSGSDGRFSIDVVPGQYELDVVGGGPLPRCPPVPVRVARGATAYARVRCDTGIR